MILCIWGARNHATLTSLIPLIKLIKEIKLYVTWSENMGFGVDVADGVLLKDESR